jgi:hypothetical protein
VGGLEVLEIDRNGTIKHKHFTHSLLLRRFLASLYSLLKSKANKNVWMLHQKFFGLWLAK